MARPSALPYVAFASFAEGRTLPRDLSPLGTRNRRGRQGPVIRFFAWPVPPKRLPLPPL
jgi:hypothetical protein